MPLLHLSKVAVGCASLEALIARQVLRRQHGSVALTTRFRPKRSDELVGGSLFWIIKHRLIARQEMLGFEDASEGPRTIILLNAEIVPVSPVPKRAHQGWRYLSALDAPPDLGDGDGGLLSLPGPLSAELARLALI